MPTTNSGSISPGTGKVTYPGATDSTGINSTSSSSATSSSNSAQSVSGMNLGSGLGVYAGTSGTTNLLLDFRTLVAGAGVDIKSDSETLTITATGTLSSDLNSLNGTLNVAKGGTGATSLLAGALLVGHGTAPVSTIPLPTAANQFLEWNGTQYAWAAVAASGSGTVSSVTIAPGASGLISVSGSPITTSGTYTVDFNLASLALNNISGTLSVTKGGTGLTSIPSLGIMYGNGTGSVQTITAPGTAGQVLTYNGTTYNWTTPATVPSNTLTSVSITGDSVVNVTGGAVNSSSVAYTLATQTSGVTAGSYVNANIAVDQYGRVTSASNGAVQAVISAVNENNGGGARIFDDVTSTSSQFNFRRIQTSASLVATENTGYVMLDLNTVSVAKGGTGATTLTTNGVLIGNGTGAVAATAAPTSVNTSLTWNGTGFVWSSSLQSVTITGTTGITVAQSVNGQNQPVFALSYDPTQTNLNSLAGTLGVPKGGTGATSFISNGVLVGNGTGTLTALAAPTTANTTLVWNGTGFVWNAFPVGSISSFTVAGDSTITVTNGAVTSSNSTVSLKLANTAVTAGVYTNPTINVDAQGRIIAAANGVGAISGAANYTGGAALFDSSVVSNTLNFRSIKSGSASLTVTQNAQDVTIDVGTVTVGKGGTGVSTLTAGGVLVGNGTSPVTVTAAPTASGQFLGWNGSNLIFTNALTAVTVAGTGAVSVISGTDANNQPSYTVSVDSTQIGANTLNGTMSVAKGGTGLTAIAPNAVVIGSADGTSFSTVAAPDTIGAVLTWGGTAYEWDIPGGGSAGTGTVTSIALQSGLGIVVTGGPITSSGSIGVAVNESALSLNNLGGTLGVAKGGIGATTLTANALIIGNGTGPVNSIAAPLVANQVLAWDGTQYLWIDEATINGNGSVTSVTVAAGSNAITVSGSPVTTSGTITVDVNQANLNIGSMSGVLPVTSGGTGLTTMGTAGQLLSVTSDGTGLQWVNPNQTGGTVTSVAVTGQSGRVTVTGSPITSSGTINVDVIESGLSLSAMGGTLTTAQGGTGLTALGTAGQVLTVNSTANAIIWKTPFSAVTAGSTKVTASTTNGTATIDVDTTKMDVSTMIGTLGITHGGTGIVALGTAGQVLTVNPQGTGYTFTTPATGGGSGSVTSVNLTAASSKVLVSGGPITSSGSITVDVDTTKMDVGTMTGTLLASHGGTGLTTIGTAGQVLTVNSGGNGLVWATPTAGSGGSSGGISEAPVDGNSYVRQSSAWLEAAPAGAIVGNTYGFLVTLGAGKTPPANGTNAASSGVTSPPAGWTFTSNASGVITATHNTGRIPSTIVLWIGTGSTTNPVYTPVSAGSPAANGAVSLAASGTTAPNTTSFQFAISSSITTVLASGVVWVEVGF